MELPDWTSIRHRLEQWVAFIGPRRLVGAIVTGVVVIAVGWWVVKPSPAPVESMIPLAGQFVPGSSIISTPVQVEIKVHVAGAVRKPGVYTLSTHARVIDAVRAAGGATSSADLVRINLAQVLVDTEQVFIPSRGRRRPNVTVAPRLKPNTSLIVPITALPPNIPTFVPVTSMPIQSSTSPTETSAGSKVNINTATAAQLDLLPGVGPATAKAIMYYRSKKGPFVKVEDLMNVPGIGSSKFAAMKSRVTVS